MTIGGFLILLFFIIGLYGLFRKDDCTFTEKELDELIRKPEGPDEKEEKESLKPHSAKE